MIENESRLDKLQQKAKIRERYKGIDPGMLEVIPAKKQADFYDDEPRRVAVYVRVSTDDPRQTSSYELQKNYYEDMVEKHPGWALVSIYPDEYTSYGQNPKRPWIPTISVFTGVFIMIDCKMKCATHAG